MVVTTRAANRQPEERAARRGQHVIQRVVARALDFVRGDLRRENAGTEKAGGHQRERILRLELVARELPARELIERHVGIERLDHEVAVMPGVRPIVIVLEPAALREARDVQPVSSPTFAVARRVQQTIHQLAPGIRRFVGEEGIDFCRRGRKAREVERRAANQGPLVGGRCELELLLGTFGGEKGVDGMTSCGRRGFGQRLERPPAAVVIRHAGFVARDRPARDERRVVGRAVLDPLGDLLDDRVGQLRLLVRHVRFQLVTEHLEQRTFRCRERFDRWPLGTATQQRLTSHEIEIGLGLLAAMTLHAMLLEQRSHVATEHLQALRHPLGMVRRHRRRVKAGGQGNDARGQN